MSKSQPGIRTLWTSARQQCPISFGVLLFMLMNTAIADSKLTLEQGLQQSFQSTQPVGRVAVGDPTIADVSVITEYEILITPQQPGVASLTIWSKNN